MHFLCSKRQALLQCCSGDASLQQLQQQLVQWVDEAAANAGAHALAARKGTAMRTAAQQRLLQLSLSGSSSNSSSRRHRVLQESLASSSGSAVSAAG